MTSADWANLVYSYFFVAATMIAGLGYVAKHYVQRNTDELKEKLNRIEYALFNDGQTGLINKVDQLIENQQLIKIDVEVLKSRRRAS